MTKKDFWTIAWIVNVGLAVIVVVLSIVEKTPLIVRLWPLMLVILLVTFLLGAVVSWTNRGSSVEEKESDSEK